MSFHLDIDKRAEAERARTEAEAALSRARLLLERCRVLLSQPAPHAPKQLSCNRVH
nr:hypothetical protein [uncultured Sphingosinicella sp.]